MQNDEKRTMKQSNPILERMPIFGLRLSNHVGLYNPILVENQGKRGPKVVWSMGFW
jgi:hypothetical protein